MLIANSSHLGFLIAEWYPAAILSGYPQVQSPDDYKATNEKQQAHPRRGSLILPGNFLTLVIERVVVVSLGGRRLDQGLKRGIRRGIGLRRRLARLMMVVVTLMKLSMG